jgi:hypothetical protein
MAKKVMKEQKKVEPAPAPKLEPEAVQEPKPKAEPVIGKPFVLKPRTDQYFYDKIKDLHDEVKKEMDRRQRAGERWLALFPVLQRLFIILQGLRIFVTVPKG